MTENLELREWIAVYVMGWEKRSTPNGAEYFVREGVDVSHEELPPYEHTWNDAALVVEAMAKREWDVEMGNCYGEEENLWLVRFERNKGSYKCHEAEAPTAPLAICLAAKAAIEGEA